MTKTIEELLQEFDEEIGTFEVKVKHILPNSKIIPAGSITNETIKRWIKEALETIQKQTRDEIIERMKRIRDETVDIYVKHGGTAPRFEADGIGRVIQCLELTNKKEEE